MLPQPRGRQKEVLYLPPEGHTVVLGTAGSGKTTLAILRSAYLAGLHSGDRVLLVTFNKMLVTYLNTVAPDELVNVNVENYHRFARGYLAARGRMKWDAVVKRENRLRLIETALHDRDSQASGLFTPEVLAREFAWMAQSGIDSPKTYVKLAKNNQSTLHVNDQERLLIFDVYSRYIELRNDGGYLYDWDDIAQAVLEELGKDTLPRRYRHVVIDEGQDFSPVMLRSLAAAIPKDGSLTFFGDVAQQIYGSKVTWRSAGLKPPDVVKFEENYRNTKQVAQLALSISKMPYYRGVADLVEPREPKADGALPAVVKCSSIEGEIRLAVNQARQWSPTQSVGILLRTRDHEQEFLSQLARNGIKAQRLHREAHTWNASPGVSVGTFASGKGLEFDTVLIPFCGDEALPDPDTMITFNSSEDVLAEEGRLLYVAVTRARGRLLITYNGMLTRLLPQDTRLYKEFDYSDRY